jgi:hypothetical protein
MDLQEVLRKDRNERIVKMCKHAVETLQSRRRVVRAARKDALRQMYFACACSEQENRHRDLDSQLTRVDMSLTDADEVLLSEIAAETEGILAGEAQ